MSVKSQEENYLSSVKNALRILRSFSVDEPEKKISELSMKLGINKSTVSRTMSTLASEGFVYKDPDTQKYRLGFSILALGGVLNSSTDVYLESQSVLNKLVANIGETAHLSVLDGTDIIYLNKVECNHPVRFLTHVGRRNPAYCTSSGKVLLAHAEQSILDLVLNQELKAFTSNTITKPEELLAHLQEIKETGYAFSYEEFTEGVSSIAAPIYNYEGKVVAAITVVGPIQRIQHHKVHGYAKKIMEAGMEISHRMGYWK